MTEQGLLHFKSDFAREIFKHDLYHIYQDQTAHRDELRRAGREKMADIVKQINSGVYENETVTMMLRELVRELDHYKGKMVYGYMPKKAKNLIDGIVDELAKDERIAELYSLWYEQRDHITRTYQDTMTQRIPLSQNKEFKTIKNAVIQEALNLLHNRITFEDEHIDQPKEDDETVEESVFKKNPRADPNDMHLKGQTSIAFAVPLRTSSANKENACAHSQSDSDVSLASFRLLAQMTQILQDDISKNDNIHFHIEKKLQQKIEEKKWMQGQKQG